MHSRTASRLVFATMLALAVTGPVAAQNPWIADGGYYEQYDSPAGTFTPHVVRWVFSSRFEPGAVEDFVAYFDCWRQGVDGGIGSNKVTVQWTATGLDSLSTVTFGKWRKRFKKGSLPGQTRVVNEIATLAAESAVLIEARLQIKGKIGPGEYVGCDMDLSEHPDGFDGSFEARARR